MDLGKPLRTRVALNAGVSRWELGNGPWEHPHRGIARHAGSDPEDPQNRIDAAIPLLTPGAVLTGWAAAFHQGVRMLDGIDRSGAPQPIPVACPDGGQLRTRPGIAPTRRRIHHNEIIEIGDVPVTTLARAAYDMALDASGLCEALVAIDMCLSTVTRQSRTTLSNIENLLDDHHKTRGIVRARRAVALASTRSASPWETRTRYEAQVGAGIEGLLVNMPVFDMAGNLAGIADLLDEESGLVIESDGAGHREEVAHASDNCREENFEFLGLFVSRVMAIDHRDKSRLRDRLATARMRSVMQRRARSWTLEKPDWWWQWEPGRRWD